MCWSHLADDNPTRLYRGTRKGFRLIADGVSCLGDIPDDFKLTENQTIQRRTGPSGKPHIDKPAIRRFLRQLRYPIHFLDFETFGTAIPLFDGLRPYRQVPFQFSMHTVRSEGAEPEHEGFLAQGPNDPRKEFMDRVRGVLGGKGSVVAFNAGFEIGR